MSQTLPLPARDLAASGTNEIIVLPGGGGSYTVPVRSTEYKEDYAIACKAMQFTTNSHICIPGSTLNIFLVGRLYA